MAATCAKTAGLRLASASARTLLTRSPSSSSSSSPSLSSAASKLGGLSCAAPVPSSSRFFTARRVALSRLPVELGGALSMMPLHSVTASALFTSLLCLSNHSWGCLSEGFATPL
ncbi:uncharacterized protein LOC104414227 [Eucalyptus grandis]|uniref:Uncharacterized protein n=2 Tax=Eucalyptus grandis TaxID=71139 RepID=A0ACC3JTD8_EUCGR|nr:uncharacterized protein LOC104414227 [Eucalyptus grandis]KAK3416861.1 hypothetical protein EUGRSUZ_H02610 [Eucalyptus grandis]